MQKENVSVAILRHPTLIISQRTKIKQTMVEQTINNKVIRREMLGSRLRPFPEITQQTLGKIADGGGGGE
jgi:hypothetical protein